MPSLDREKWTYAEWVADVRRRGGVPTRMPPQYAGTPAEVGQLAARFKIAGTDRYTYELAPLSLRIQDGRAQLASLSGTEMVFGSSRLEEKGAEVVQAIQDATGIGDGLSGVAAKALGIPRSMVLLLGAVAIYGALVQAGIAPPLRKLLK